MVSLDYVVYWLLLFNMVLMLTLSVAFLTIQFQVYIHHGQVSQNVILICISLLVKSIGGPWLLYVLQKSQGFASWRTVGWPYRIPRLLPSIGIPSANEINNNIASFFDLSAKPQPTPTQNGCLLGNIVMIDGIALETRYHYCHKHNSILGLYREHSSNVDTKVTSLDSVEKVHVALLESQDDATKVCFASNATVVGIAPYAWHDHYSPIPIVASPSDK